MILLCVLQFITYRADSQEQTLNINVNNTYHNINVAGNQSLNRNAFFPTGPNGPGGTRGMAINVVVLDKGTGLNIGGGPNVRGYTPSVQRLSNQSANKPKTARPSVQQVAKPKRQVAATPAVQGPKPETTATSPRQKGTRRAAPAVAVPAPAPVQVAVSSPVINTANEPLVVQQVMNDDHNTMPENVISDQVSVPATSAGSAPAVRSSAASSGSGSSGRHRFGRKKHGSFYYSTNKKVRKLFAKTKGRKFDPAKCFVWK